MFSITRISRGEKEYVVEYTFNGKQEEMRISIELAEWYKPHELFYWLERAAIDRQKAGARGKLVKEWN